MDASVISSAFMLSSYLHRTFCKIKVFAAWMYGWKWKSSIKHRNFLGTPTTTTTTTTLSKISLMHHIAWLRCGNRCEHNARVLCRFLLNRGVNCSNRCYRLTPALLQSCLFDLVTLLWDLSYYGIYLVLALQGVSGAVFVAMWDIFFRSSVSLDWRSVGSLPNIEESSMAPRELLVPLVYFWFPFAVPWEGSRAFFPICQIFVNFLVWMFDEFNNF